MKSSSSSRFLRRSGPEGVGRKVVGVVGSVGGGDAGRWGGGGGRGGAAVGGGGLVVERCGRGGRSGRAA